LSSLLPLPLVLLLPILLLKHSMLLLPEQGPPVVPQLWRLLKTAAAAARSCRRRKLGVTVMMASWMARWSLKKVK
jgi:hypothetical protein